MAERIVVENRALRLALEPDGRVAELSNIMSGLFSNRGRELFRLRYRGEELAQGDFPPPEVSRCRDSTQELVTLLFRHRELPLEMRVQLINDLNCSISVLYQLRDHSRPARPAQTLLRSASLFTRSVGAPSTSSGTSPPKISRPPLAANCSSSSTVSAQMLSISGTITAR